MRIFFNFFAVLITASLCASSSFAMKRDSNGNPKFSLISLLTPVISTLVSGLPRLPNINIFYNHQDNSNSDHNNPNEIDNTRARSDNDSGENDPPQPENLFNWLAGELRIRIAGYLSVQDRRTLSMVDRGWNEWLRAERQRIVLQPYPTFANDLRNRYEIPGRGLAGALEHQGLIFLLLDNRRDLGVFNIQRNEMSQIEIASRSTSPMSFIGYSSNRMAIFDRFLYVIHPTNLDLDAEEDDRDYVAVVDMSTLEAVGSLSMPRLEQPVRPHALAICNGWLFIVSDAGTLYVARLKLEKGPLALEGEWASFTFHSLRVINMRVMPQGGSLLLTMTREIENPMDGRPACFYILNTEGSQNVPTITNNPRNWISLRSDMTMLNGLETYASFDCMRRAENFVRITGPGIYYLARDRQNQIWIVRNTHNELNQNFYQITLDQNEQVPGNNRVFPDVWGFAVIDHHIFIGVVQRMGDKLVNQIIRVTGHGNGFLQPQTFNVPDHYRLSNDDSELVDLIPSERRLYFRLIEDEGAYHTFYFDIDTHKFWEIRAESDRGLCILVGSDNMVYPFTYNAKEGYNAEEGEDEGEEEED